MADATESQAIKESFGGPETAKVVGISYRQLDHWARKGLVTPSVTPARGSGSQRRYSYQDLLELKVVKRLRDAGLSLQRIERAFRYIREHLNEHATELRIFSDGTNVYAQAAPTTRSSTCSTRARSCSASRFGRVFEELDGSIAELHPPASVTDVLGEPGRRVVQG